MRRAAQRQMPLAAKEPRGRVHSDPARAGKIDLRPGVKIGEIAIRSHRPFDRIEVFLELDEIAGDEARRKAEAPQDLDEQPGGVAAGARAQCQRFVRRLNAGLHADYIADVSLQVAR